MRECNACKAKKPLEEFYKNKACVLGRESTCKECRKKGVREYVIANHEKVKAQKRQQYHRCIENNREKNRTYSRLNPEKNKVRSKRWRINHPKNHLKRVNDQEKRRIQQQLQKAVKKGLINKLWFCENCFKKVEKLEGHHRDYNKPLEVLWLCKKCHAEEHRMYE